MLPTAELGTCVAIKNVLKQCYHGITYPKIKFKTEETSPLNEPVLVMAENLKLRVMNTLYTVTLWRVCDSAPSTNVTTYLLSRFISNVDCLWNIFEKYTVTEKSGPNALCQNTKKTPAQPKL